MAVHGDVARGDGWELRCGPYQDCLADVADDVTLITDPPFSGETHDRRCDGPGHNGLGTPCDRTALPYDAWEDADIDAFAARWVTVRGWAVVISDHGLARRWRARFGEAGRATFAPVAMVTSGVTVRLTGDGPANWTSYANVSRPKTLRKWGALPGAYVGTPGERAPCQPKHVREVRHPGGKTLAHMRHIVRDYSRRGDLIVDPCAGGATTLLAAVIEGRRAIGAEIDPVAFARAVKRLRRGHTPTFAFAAAE